MYNTAFTLEIIFKYMYNTAFTLEIIFEYMYNTAFAMEIFTYMYNTAFTLEILKYMYNTAGALYSKAALSKHVLWTWKVLLGFFVLAQVCVRARTPISYFVDLQSTGGK